ncbi:MAG: hypothetical protein CL949_15640 [Erythrobacter sp.]|nr:hypothetical protein [Erythrobacter sp.]
MTSDDTRSPEEIEREIERERASLSDTLDDLQSRFSIEHLARQFSDQFREHGGDIGRSVSDAVKRNPMALALTGVGLAWLMMSDKTGEPDRSSVAARRGWPYRNSTDDDDFAETGTPRVTARSDRDLAYGSGQSRSQTGTDEWLGRPSSYVTRRRDLPAWAQRDERGDGAIGGARDFASNTKHGVKDAASSATDAARNAGATVTDKAQNAASALADAGRSVADSARDMAGSASDKARDVSNRLYEGTEMLADDARERVVAARRRAVEASEAAMRLARRGSDRAVDLFEEQPLIGGAIALALGAALAAALPRTRMEDDYLGAQSDQLMDEAERIFEEEKQKLSKVAEAATDEAKSMAADVKAKAERVAKTAVDQAKESGSKIADAAQTEADKQDLGNVKKNS